MSTPRRHTTRPSPAILLTALGLLGPLVPAALAQATADYAITDAQVYQTIQNGSIGLTAGKSTFVRMHVLSSGTVPPGTMVDGLMRIYIGGVEASYSPIYSDNGPIVPPTVANPDLVNDSLNFVFLPPESSNMRLVLELNPMGPTQVPETDFSNNQSVLNGLAFTCKRIPELIYVPIDYRPTGGTVPNLPDQALIKPGVGDGFIMGIYPSADWNYRRSDLPSKLWTSSLSGIGTSLLNALFADYQLLNPKPDFMYGWVPGPLPGYNGQALGIPGVVGMGNTDLIRFQRTAAHELGHLTGLPHNGTTNNTYGIDVERQLSLPLDLPLIKDPSLRDIMFAGLLTEDAWVSVNSYTYFQGIAAFNCSTPLTALPTAGKEALMITGEWNTNTGTYTPGDVLAVVGAVPTPFVDPAAANLILRVQGNGQSLGEFGLLVKSSLDCPVCRGVDEDHEHSADDPFKQVTLEPLAVVLPNSILPKSITALELVDPATGRVVWKLARSNAAPQVAFTQPTASAVLGTEVQVAWTATDADGDPLSSYLVYSPDGERRIPLLTRSNDSSYTLELGSLPRPKPGLAYLELSVSDGLWTSRAQTEGFGASGLSLGVGGNAPFIGIYHPDTGFRFPSGATVVLHGNAWDLEDRYLDGPSVRWFSNLDGEIGTGRLTSTAQLSAGSHTITMQVTDSSGQVASESVIVVVKSRVLPGMPPVFCQTDLSFGGPGSASLSLCGEPLNVGNSAELAIQGAAPLAPFALAIGSVNSPLPLLGGTLVPNPVVDFLFGSTDALGGFQAPVSNNGFGPATLYLQAFVLDGAEAQGVAITNALQVAFLP